MIICKKMKYSFPIACIGLISILIFSLKTELRITLSANTVDNDTKIRDPVPEYALKAQAMADLDTNTLRWDVRDMGCFILVPKNKKHPKITEVKFDDEVQITRESCIDNCFQKKYTLSALNTAKNCCMCSTGFEGFISNHEIRSAISSDKAGKSRSSSRFHVYSRISNCEKGISEESLQQKRVGCMLIPKRLNGEMIALSGFQISIEQCIWNCEMRQFTYAVPIPQRSVCLCSDSYSLFESVDNMTRIMSRCNDKTEILESDKEVEVFRTTIIDKHCSPIRFLPLKQNKPILLTSYYGSGNTWIRHLIEIATGIYTGSVYNDEVLYEGGMLGEYLPYSSGRTIVVKDHLFELKISPLYTMAVLLIRNPYDATLAEFVRRKTLNHTGVVNNDIFRTPDFKRFASNRPDYWFGITNVVLKTFMEKVVVVYFEDLVNNTIEEIRRVVEFLPKDIVGPDKESFERRFMCMNLDFIGKFRRPPRKLNFDPFDALVRNEFDKKIREMNDLLLEHNHPSLPDSYF